MGLALLSRPTAYLSQIVTWKIDREAKSSWPSLPCSFVTITAMGPVAKSWAASIQSEWLRDIFHILDATTSAGLARLQQWGQ